MKPLIYEIKGRLNQIKGESIVHHVQLFRRIDGDTDLFDPADYF